MSKVGARRCETMHSDLDPQTCSLSVRISGFEQTCRSTAASRSCAHKTTHTQNAIYHAEYAGKNERNPKSELRNPKSEPDAVKRFAHELAECEECGGRADVPLLENGEPQLCFAYATISGIQTQGLDGVTPQTLDPRSSPPNPRFHILFVCFADPLA
eukprot:2756374-Rhodomonas_salina.1